MRNFWWIAAAFSAGYLTHMAVNPKTINRLNKQEEISKLLMQTLDWISSAVLDDGVSVEEFDSKLKEKLQFIELIMNG